MKIECSLDKIKSAVTQSEKITGKNLTLPILSAILITATGKSIKIRATNLSLGIDVEIPAKIESEGIVAVRGDVLASAFSGLFGDTVSIELVEGGLVVKTKNSKIILKTLPHEDFPTIPGVDGEKITVPVKNFIDGISSVFYAAAISDIKPEISSVYLYPDSNNEIVFVSTDSFRLAEKRIKIKNIPDFPPIIIPYKNVVEIIRVFSGVDGDITITLSKNQISLAVSAVYLTSRIIDGVFPDYKQIIPKESKTTAIVLKQDMVNALKTSNIFSDKFNQITISVKPQEKVFDVYAQNNDTGENTTAISASLKGEAISIHCNYKYIVDCFQSIKADSISFDFAEQTRPVVLRGVSDNSFLYLVMPMNR